MTTTVTAVPMLRSGADPGLIPGFLSYPPAASHTLPIRPNSSRGSTNHVLSAIGLVVQAGLDRMHVTVVPDESARPDRTRITKSF